MATMLLTVAQVAERLKVSMRHVWAMTKEGKMPRPVRLGSSVRWQESVLNDWIAKGCPDMEAFSKEAP